MATWTNSVFQEVVMEGDKTRYNCAIAKCGCYRKDTPNIDCRNCTMPLLFPEEARAIVNSKRRQ